MEAKYIFFIIASLVIFALGFVFIIMKTDDNNKTKHSNHVNNFGLTWGFYADLVNSITKINELIATAEEYNELIKQNAEVVSSVLDEKDDAYKSDTFILIQRTRTINDIRAIYCIVSDMYEIFKEFHTPSEVKNILNKNIVFITEWLSKNDTNVRP